MFPPRAPFFAVTPAHSRFGSRRAEPASAGHSLRRLERFLREAHAHLQDLFTPIHTLSERAL